MSDLMSNFRAENTDIARKCNQKKGDFLSASAHLGNVAFLRKI